MNYLTLKIIVFDRENESNILDELFILLFEPQLLILYKLIMYVICLDLTQSTNSY